MSTFSAKIGRNFFATYIFVSLFTTGKSLIGAPNPDLVPFEATVGEALDVNEDLAVDHKNPVYSTNNPEQIVKYDYQGTSYRWSTTGYSDFKQKRASFFGTVESPSLAYQGAASLDFLIKLKDKKPFSSYKLTVQYQIKPGREVETTNSKPSLSFVSRVGGLSFNTDARFVDAQGYADLKGDKMIQVDVFEMGKIHKGIATFLINPIVKYPHPLSTSYYDELWKDQGIVWMTVKINNLDQFDFWGMTVKFEEVPDIFSTNLENDVFPVMSLCRQSSNSTPDYFYCLLDLRNSSDLVRPSTSTNNFIRSLYFQQKLTYDNQCEYKDFDYKGINSLQAGFDLIEKDSNAVDHVISNVNLRSGQNELNLQRRMDDSDRLEFFMHVDHPRGSSASIYLKRDCHIDLILQLALPPVDTIKTYTEQMIGGLKNALKQKEALATAKRLPGSFVVLADMPVFFQEQIDYLDRQIALSNDENERQELTAQKAKLELILEQVKDAVSSIKTCDKALAVFCNLLVSAAEEINANYIASLMSELKEINAFVESEIDRLNTQGSSAEAELLSELKAKLDKANY